MTWHKSSNSAGRPNGAGQVDTCEGLTAGPIESGGNGRQATAVIRGSATDRSRPTHNGILRQNRHGSQTSTFLDGDLDSAVTCLPRPRRFRRGRVAGGLTFRCWAVRPSRWIARCWLAFAAAAGAGPLAAGPARGRTTPPPSPASRSAAATGSSKSPTTNSSAAASGTTTGLVHFFTGAHGTSTCARHACSGGQPMPAIFASTIASGHKIDDVRIAFAGGNVKDFSVEPPLPPMRPNASRSPSGHRKACSTR